MMLYRCNIMHVPDLDIFFVDSKGFGSIEG